MCVVTNDVTICLEKLTGCWTYQDVSVEKDLKVVFFFSADERILKLWAPPCSSTETATPLWSSGSKRRRRDKKTHSRDRWTAKHCRNNWPSRLLVPLNPLTYNMCPDEKNDLSLNIYKFWLFFFPGLGSWDRTESDQTRRVPDSFQTILCLSEGEEPWQTCLGVKVRRKLDSSRAFIL